MNNIEFENKLKETCLRHNLLTMEQVMLGFNTQKQDGGTWQEAMFKLRLLEPGRLAPVLEEITGATHIDPSLMSQNPDYLATVAHLLPPPFAIATKVFPVKSHRNEIQIACFNPLDEELLSLLEGFTGMRVLPRVCHMQGIINAHAMYYPPEVVAQYSRAQVTDPQGKISREFADSLLQPRLDRSLEEWGEDAIQFVNRNYDRMMRSEEGFEEALVQWPIIMLIHQYLCRAVYSGASDVHFEPQEKYFRVRTRIDGILSDTAILPVTMAIPIIGRVQAMADADVHNRNEMVDTRIDYDMIPYRRVEYRVSLLPSINGHKAVLRILDQEGTQLQLEDLGYSESQYDIVTRNIKKANGINLVTGPTGSGKTNTLYTILRRVNQPDVCVVTAEDPVESKIEGTTQVLCGKESTMTFALALKSFLRQDPDIIMVGEIRDQETADIALRAALTGHLVFSTLHTNDAPSAITRMLDMGLEPFLITAAVNMIMAQRLPRRLCKSCKVPLPADHPDTLKVREVLKIPATEELVIHGPKEKGCPACRTLGYKGRMGIFEVLEMNDTLREMVVHQASTDELRQAARQSGMTTLLEHGCQKVQAGLTSLDEIYRVA